MSCGVRLESDEPFSPVSLDDIYPEGFSFQRQEELA
jgi:hypothetical protein